MRPRRWSECGSRGRFRKPSPGGSGPPLGRHYDRSPRSAVNSGQVATGNAQCAGSQETRELELSRCWMRPARRAPRWSAERRAVSAETAAAPEARTDGNIRWRGAAPRQCAYRRSASLLLSGGIWKGFRTVAWQNSGASARRENENALSAPAKRGRGTTRSVVEGASEMELRCRCRRIVAARAPPTALCAVPPPRYRGAGCWGSVARTNFTNKRNCSAHETRKDKIVRLAVAG